MKCAMVVHGGVGTPEDWKDGPERAIERAWKELLKGNFKEAAVLAAQVMEDDERFNAGFGSNLRLDGQTVEMDAAFMTSDGKIGAVACVRRVKNPVRLAFAVWDSPHVMLAGEGAIWFAEQRGIPLEDRISERAREKFEKLKRAVREGKLKKHPRWKDYNLCQYWNYPRPVPEWVFCDTIGVVVRSKQGDFAAALSTGGAGTMMLGRVGDTPLVGSGFFVGEKGAVAATGLGEAIVEKLLAFRVYQKMEEGMSAQKACEWGISLYEESIPVGLIAVDARGMGCASNWSMAWACREES